MTFLELLELVNEADNKLNGEQLTPDEHVALLQAQAEEDEDSDNDVKKGTASTPQSDKIDKLQQDINDTEAELNQLSSKTDKTTDDVDNLNTLQNRLQVMYSNLAEEEKRLSLYPEVETYERKIKAGERYEKKRGLQSLFQSPESEKVSRKPSEKDTAKTLAADVAAIRAEVSAETERADYELHTGTGRKPFAPDVRGIQNPQVFNIDDKLKRVVHEPWNFKSLKNYRKNIKTGKWESVSKSKAFDVPRMVGKVFNAVAESSAAENYFNVIDNIFSDYMSIYERILENANTYKFGKERVEYLEARLDIAQNVMVANTEKRIEQGERKIARLPEQIRMKEQEVRSIISSNGDATAQLIELKLLKRDYADSLEKSPTQKGKARDVYSEARRLMGQKVNLETELSNTIQLYTTQLKVTEKVYEKLSDETLTPEARAVIDKVVEEERSKVMPLLNTSRELRNKYDQICGELTAISKRIVRYEERIEKGKEEKAPEISNSRQFSSSAFELKKQKQMVKTFNGLVNSIKYGKVVLKELKKADADRVIQRNNEYVLPYNSYKGEERFYKAILRETRDGETKTFIIDGYKKGLNGYGTRPGRDEKGYEAEPIKGFGENEGYYQTLEKCQHNLQELSSQLDSKRDSVLDQLIKTLDKAVGMQFTTGVTSEATNPGLNAIKAWVGLKKLQRMEQRGELESQTRGEESGPHFYSLAQYTIDPVASLYNFYKNSRVRKLRKLDTRTTQLSDIVKQLSHITRSLPAEHITDLYRSGSDKRLKAIYDTAMREATGAIKATGDDRLLSLMKDYFNMKISKIEFLNEVKKTTETPAPTPSNVIQGVFKSEGEAEDFGDLGDMIVGLVDADVEAALSEPILTPAQQKEVETEQDYYDSQVEKLDKLTGDINEE